MGVENSEEGGEAGLPAFLLDFLYLHKYNDTRIVRAKSANQSVGIIIRAYSPNII